MRSLFSLAALLTLLGASGGSWYLWDLTPPAIIPAGRYVFALAAAIALVALVKVRRLPTLADLANPQVWGLGLVAIFVSGWLCRPYNFFQAPEFRTEIAIAAGIATLATYFRWREILVALPILAALWSVYTFISESGGALLFSDDHAMFIFRLKLLKDNFPSIPFWSPLWNAGFDARDFFATGSLNAFILASPLLYLFSIESVYNLIICGILFIVTPLSGYIAARLLHPQRIVASISALLVMSTSLFWYRWALKYGTVGFIVSTALIPLTLALYLRFISSKTIKWREGIALIVCSTLVLLWSPSGLALAPLALLAIPHLRTLLSSRKHLITIALIVIINLPWMLIMWRVSNVGNFLGSENPTQTATTHASTIPSTVTTYRHHSDGISFKQSLKNWHEAATSANPLILVFAIPAIFGLSKPYRLAFGLLCAWLTTLGTLGVSLKPQLELDRMLVIAGVIASFPIAITIWRIFESIALGVHFRLTAIVVGSALFASPMAVHKMLTNQLFDKYSFAKPEVAEISSTIARFANGGRALFTGCVLHQLSDGHLGPLPYWSNTPMIASSYAHNIWRYEQPIPESFLKDTDTGINRFLDLMNVSVVLAHEPEWLSYLQQRPSLFVERSRFKEFTLYERIGFKPTYVLDGQADYVIQNFNSVSLLPLSDRVVIKFKYYPFLTSSNCSIKPYPVSPEISLIELTHCTPGIITKLSSVTAYQRITF